MAYENFISTVEAKKLLDERDKYLILADHCTREWEGEIKKKGDSVTIKGLGRPTIYSLNAKGDYTANGVGTGSVAGKGKDVIHKGIPSAEELTTFEKKFEVNQIAVFNYLAGDIDEQQSSFKGIVDRARPKTAQDIAALQDERVRDVIIAVEECNAYENAIKLSSGVAGSGETNILDFVDEVVMQLRNNNVKDSEELFGECSPAFLRRLKVALRNIDTNNSKIVRGRECTSYNGVNFFMANAMIKGSDEYVFIRTKDSVAFFDPLTKVEAYRPEGGFADAIKGFNLFDAGVVDEKACKFAKISGYAG
jgi:hypothetical protein